jgi:hypothetical protein
MQTRRGAAQDGELEGWFPGVFIAPSGLGITD